MHCSRVDAFRHRAAPIIADHAGVSHVCRLLTLTGGRTKARPPVLPDKRLRDAMCQMRNVTKRETSRERPILPAGLYLLPHASGHLEVSACRCLWKTW